MYVIAVYDVEEKKVAKMLKLFRQYLNWIQNSVFEGELTEAQLLKLENSIKRIIDSETDSVIIFKFRDQKWADKKIIGKEKNSTSNFI